MRFFWYLEGKGRHSKFFYVSASLPNFQSDSNEKLPEQELKPPKTEQKQLDKGKQRKNQ